MVYSLPEEVKERGNFIKALNPRIIFPTLNNIGFQLRKKIHKPIM
jgi:hypothetical protein